MLDRNLWLWVGGEFHQMIMLCLACAAHPKVFKLINETLTSIAFFSVHHYENWKHNTSLYFTIIYDYQWLT